METRPAWWRQPDPTLSPMLASPATEPPAGDGWAHEFKWDGVRALVSVVDGQLSVRSRNDRPVTASYPELLPLNEALTDVVLDGEIVALDTDGRPDFGRLQARMHVTQPARVAEAARAVPVHFFAFDILHLDGRSLLSRPYDDRRDVLESLGLDGAAWTVPPSFPGEGAAVLAASKAQGLEGMVSKRRDSAYESGRRSPCWRKLKHIRTQAAVVIGFKPGEGTRAGVIGSLILAVPDEDGQLRYAGHVGSGFTEDGVRSLTRALAELRQTSPPPGILVPREHTKGAVWLDPILVVEVGFGAWTADGRMRHPIYRGLRPDTQAGQVVREP